MNIVCLRHYKYIIFWKSSFAVDLYESISRIYILKVWNNCFLSKDVIFPHFDDDQQRGFFINDVNVTIFAPACAPPSPSALTRPVSASLHSSTRSPASSLAAQLQPSVSPQRRWALNSDINNNIQFKIKQCQISWKSLSLFGFDF